MNKLKRWIFKKFLLNHINVRWGSSPDIGAWAEIYLFGICVSTAYRSITDDTIRWTNQVV